MLTTRASPNAISNSANVSSITTDAHGVTQRSDSQPAYVVKPVKFSDFIEAVKQVGAFWAVVNEVPPAGPRPVKAVG